MDNENFYLSVNGEIFRLVDFLASLDSEAADNGEEVDAELVSAILALEIGESIGEGLNMETITRVAGPAVIDEAGVAPDYANMPNWKFVLLQIRLAKSGRISPKMCRYTVRFTDGTWGLFGPKPDQSMNPLCWWKDTYITGTVKHKQVLRTTAKDQGLNILGSYGDHLVWVGPNEIMSTVSVY
jgi:hypothetical protein